MTEQERMRSGALYRADAPELSADRARCRALLARYNQTAPEQSGERARLLRALLGRAGDGLYIEPPFRCDYGRNIYVGSRVYVNYELIVLDVCDVTIGDDVLIGPRVSLLAAAHPIDPETRASGLEYGAPIRIESRAWLGGGVIVNPGVTIGADSVVGSGAVVTRDIPPGTVAAGNPCRVLRPITQADRDHWARLRAEYEASR